MLFAIYNLLWYLALPFALSAAGGSDAAVKAQRQGRLRLQAVGAPRLWIHASSVGEVEGVRTIVAGILKQFPHAAIVVTTMTATGREAAIARIPGAAAVMFAPLDFAPAVRAFLGGTRPNLVIVAENELWPNYLIQSRRAGARVVIANGRMSARSASRYRLVRGLFRRALRSAELVMVQSDADAQRYASLGVDEKRLIVTGNTKIDLGGSIGPARVRPAVAAFAQNRPLFVAASTAPGEEAAAASAYIEMRDQFRDLAMVVAPRHPERAGEAAKALDAVKLDFVRASTASESAAASARVMLLDTIGELRSFFPRASIAFVGGSLTPGRGGQSPAEAAAAGVPVMMGRHHQNQLALVSLLKESGGLKIIANSHDMAKCGIAWLAGETDRLRAANAARAAILKASGAGERALEKILPMLATAV